MEAIGAAKEAVKTGIAEAMDEKKTCPQCHMAFVCRFETASAKPRYCPFCRSSLDAARATTLPVESQSEVTVEPGSSSVSSSSSISFLSEHLPVAEEIQFTIGPYQVLSNIGKGGMGEVFLAYDTTCGRRIALKKIRPDLIEHKNLHNRFLKEARITSQLTHPAIITIYAIHSENTETYYTMPYVEGETLKQILRKARQLERKGDKSQSLSGSIPALIRIFLSICQAVAYAHSKHVLHRDIKPENIIVGQYGQIVILDWGLAKLLKGASEDNEDEIEEKEEDEPININPLHHLTHIGKIVGTVAYMAPERALGHPANFQTDIYSLGVILYQLLTLKHPFQRGTLKEFRQQMHLEKVVNPIEVAPYRDIPRSLARVVMKCLAPQVEQRYHSVDELIHDLENYIEGRSEWFQMAELDIKNKADWEFQENVLIAEHIALMHDTGLSDWVSLMISAVSFQENIKLEATVKIGEHGHGIGFLLSIPEAAERSHLNDGYCLWLGTDRSRSTKLLRSTLEVVSAPDLFLKRHEWYRVRIEKIDNNIHFYLNDVLQFSYISHLPLAGTHVGILSRDADFMLKDFVVFVGSQNVTVNCLAVPDAFLSHKNYSIALNEYRRIGYSFPGRAEGREAMFRAGITLLEQANNTFEKEKKLDLYDQAQEEFEKLHNTPGAPLEYLGKALVYQALGDYEEEAKCFELAYRRYPKHPLLPILQEQIVYRMHESSRYNRQATFNFILFVLRYLPSVIGNNNTQKLLNSLEKHWEPLFFVEQLTDASDELKNIQFAIKLAFWLGKPLIFEELFARLIKKEIFHSILMGNIFFCMLEMGHWQWVQGKLEQIVMPDSFKELFQIAVKAHSESIEEAAKALLALPINSPSSQIERVLVHLMQTALDRKKPEIVHQLYEKIPRRSLSHESQLKVDEASIWAYLLEKNWQRAGEILYLYPLEYLNQESSLLHFLYGCWLYVTEGKEIAQIHFSGVFEVAYPRSWNLFSYYINGKIAEETEGWQKKSFEWERGQLYRQLSLFYHCIGDEEKANAFESKVRRQ